VTVDNPLGLAAHHITGLVVDLDRAIAWYQRILGCTLLELGSHQDGALRYAELKLGDFGIGLIQLQGQARLPVSPGPPIAPSWLHIVFAVRDPDATFQLLKARGAEVFTRTPQPSQPLSAFLARDSEGNELEIVVA